MISTKEECGFFFLMIMLEIINIGLLVNVLKEQTKQRKKKKKCKNILKKFQRCWMEKPYVAKKNMLIIKKRIT
jgi:hypothetical protein